MEVLTTTKLGVFLSTLVIPPPVTINLFAEYLLMSQPWSPQQPVCPIVSLWNRGHMVYRGEGLVSGFEMVSGFY